RLGGDEQGAGERVVLVAEVGGGGDEDAQAHEHERERAGAGAAARPLGLLELVLGVGLGAAVVVLLGLFAAAEVAGGLAGAQVARVGGRREELAQLVAGLGDAVLVADPDADATGLGQGRRGDGQRRQVVDEVPGGLFG